MATFWQLRPSRSCPEQKGAAAATPSVGQDTGSAPRREPLQEGELSGLQPVPKFVPPNSLRLGENRAFTSNSLSGGHAQGSHPPLPPVQGQSGENCEIPLCRTHCSPFPFPPVPLRAPASQPARWDAQGASIRARRWLAPGRGQHLPPRRGLRCVTSHRRPAALAPTDGRSSLLRAEASCRWGQRR